MNHALRIKNLTVSLQSNYFKKHKVILHNFSLTALPGKIIALVGDNGSGKTTLLKTIAGLIPTFSGEILKSNDIYFIPEQANPMPFLTAYDFLWYQAKLTPIKNNHNHIEKALNAVNLLPNKHIKIKCFSKGMRQRLYIAGALISHAQLILLDEPFSGLDLTSKRIVEQLIFEKKTNQTILYSCHEPLKIPDQQIVVLKPY